MIKRTNKSLDGTSFHGITIKTSLGRLQELFPDSVEMFNDDKVKYYFTLETNSGHPFSIYDWKYYRDIESGEVIEWNIGSFTKEVSQEAFEEINKII